MPFQFDSHSLHKKLRLSNHNYTVYREESGSRAKKESLMGGYSSSNISMYGVTGNVAIDNGRHYWEVGGSAVLFSIQVMHRRTNVTVTPAFRRCNELALTFTLVYTRAIRQFAM